MNGQPNAALAEVEKHIPRAYQDEIFAKARYTNIIAALDTGSGKTLISTLLIKSICARTTSIGKKIIFLVPKVPLVEQQKTFIEDQTPLRVKGYYGAMNVDAWNMSQWHSEFDKADVLVMTAQIFLNILTHAFWKLENVSLIIFDECHHAQRNHPYNTIMCDFYRQCPQEHRPQVFGMTASPIWNLKKPRESLRQLETNLFSTVLAVKEHTDELTKHSPKPTEIVKFYRRSPISYPSYMSPSLWDRIQSDTAISSTFVASARSRYEVSLSAIGPYGADKYLYDYLKWKLQALVDVEHEEMLKVPTIIPQPEQSVNTVESAEPLIDRPSADWLRNVLLEFDQYLLVDCAIQTGWLSPKLIAIVELLKKYKSSSFQGILFVEQRQVAMVLSWLLPRLPELNGWLRCDDLVGHGEDEVVKGMNRKSQKEIVHSFREKHFNLLVATSVAEEGLDFPACELVIRYDTIKHMVGYLQSRGRARHQASTYVVMIEEDNQAEITRYENFRRSEPELRTIYQNGDEKVVSEDMGDDEPDNPDDLAERELYIIPSTGATLSYGSSISLLNHLCSLIPRDKFTSVLKPKYVGDFVVTVELPSALPLGKEQRIYQGLPKRTKKEAKRVAAFIAARALHRLGVFDDNLSPIKATSGDKIEDADGHLIPDISEIPEMILTNVRDPWSCAWDLWLHVISIQPDGSPSAGLITGSRLPSLDLNANGLTVTLRDAFLVQTAYDESEKREQLHLMEAFMKVGLEWCVTRSPISAPLSCYLVPIDEVNMQPDWETMKKAVAHPRGNYDWNNIKDGYEDDLLLMNSKKTGHTLILHRIRHDLTSQSRPEADSDIDATLFPTYGDYFFKKYSSSKVAVELPVEGPLLEVCSFQRNRSARYLPESISPREFSPPATVPSFFVPRIFCKWLYFPRKLFETYRILPQLCHRVTDVYRVRCACRELKLSLSLANDFLVEAFTLPCANAGFNNQRLETLGDSVLKLCVVVHIYNQFPSKHEGQLDSIKKNCISNRVLCTRGYAVGLQQFLTSEIQDLKSWRYVTETDDTISSSLNFVPRIIPRRSLQDCMEASLGASYLTGKIELALHTGTSLNLSFGGTRAWKDRYMRLPVSPVPPLFKNLEVSLGYTFHNGGLLLEALTHPSYDSSAVSCYQRLEFLGDAVLELAITEHLFSKFPQAKSGRLSMTRAKAVCGPTLAAVAVKEFKLHKYILTNNVALDKAVTQEISALESTEYEQFLRKGWQYDPPKVLSDVLESLMGAVLVDSGYDYLMTFSLIKKAMCSVLEILTVDLPLDPVSELMIWTAKAGCRRIHFRKFRSSEMLRHCDSYSVLVHDQSVAESGAAPNLSLAKGLAATQALAKLSDSTSDLALSMICNCLQLENTAVSKDQVEAEIISDETDDGYAHIAYSHLQNSTGIVDGLETDVFGDITEENQ